VLSRYTDVNNIIKYIQTQEIEEDITKGNVNNIASNYVALNFSKQLGRKKLVAIKKKSIDILHSQAVKHYTQYLTSSKQINHIQPQNNNNHSMLQKLFKKIQKIPAPSKFNTTDINFITTIPSLDYFILDTISYNNKQQIIDE